MKQKIKKNFPRLTIERVLTNDEGRVVGIDIHDEKFGTAIYFNKGVEHYHGFDNNGIHND